MPKLGVDFMYTFYSPYALCVVHVIIHRIEYSGDEFLNEYPYFLSPNFPFSSSRCVCVSFSLYFICLIPLLNTIQHLCCHWKMWTNYTLCSKEWKTQQQNKHTHNLPWHEFDSWNLAIVKPAMAIDEDTFTRNFNMNALNCWSESTHITYRFSFLLLDAEVNTKHTYNRTQVYKK